MATIRWKKGTLHINEHELDIISTIQTLGVILLIVIAFFQGMQVKAEQRDFIKKHCGDFIINLSNQKATNTNTNFNNITIDGHGEGANSRRSK